MKFTKKQLSFIVPLLVVGLVAAVLTYYALVTIDLTIKQPIEVSGDGLQEISCELGYGEGTTICPGNEITVSNTGISEGTISIIGSEIVDGGQNVVVDGIDVSYIGTLVLAKKTINDVGVWTPTDDTITVEYTVVGDTFEYEVVEGALPDNYVLVYAMDKDDRFTNYATVMKLDEVSKNLPFAEDWNAGQEADYCASLIDIGYKHCRGAKIWAVNEIDLVEDAPTNGFYPLNWANMWSFYWETDLIEFNKEGQITVYPGETLDFTPEYTIDNYLEGGIYSQEIKIA